MIAVTHITAFTNYLLITAASVTGITGSVHTIAFPWVTLVHHNFIAMVRVEMVTWGQSAGMYPYIVFKVNILMARYVIISIGIRDIIIFGMVIAYRAPLGLAANIEAEVNT
jgi:hypothetical protein